jgi:hypothetical protein
MTTGHDRSDFYPGGFLRDARWQAETMRQLQSAGYLLVRSDPRHMPEWTPPLQQYVATNFRLLWIGPSAPIRAQLWVRTNS